MRKFRLLKASEIECRVARCTENGVSLLLYKTARTDAALLDETVGAERWENDFKLIDGVLFGGLGVDYNGDGHFVWKWDAGTESNTEAEKGRASDAFKRAGFKHGIGRELYTAPFIWVKASDTEIYDTKRKDKYGNPIYACNARFTVRKIEYDEDGNISGLIIYSGRNCVYEYGYK